MSEHSGEFATEPVPEDRTVGWFRVALVSAMVGFSLLTFITGLEVANSVSPDQAIKAIVLGSLILAAIGSVTGSIGSRTRLSSYMLVRIAFGYRGAALVNLAFAISLLGWFGVNIDLFGSAVLRLLTDEFGVQAKPWLVELSAGAVMTVTTLYGFRAINMLSTLLVPVLVAVTALLVYVSLDTKPLTEIFASTSSSMTLGNATSAVVGAIIVGAVILPDITRFIRHWRGAVYTAVLAYLVIGVIVMGAGGLATLAMDNDDLLDIMILMGLGWAAFAIVIAGSWVLNSLNLYSTMLSVESTWPKLDNRLLVVGLGILGTLAAFLNILDYLLSFLFYLAIVFVPVAGVIIIDYLLIRRSAYHERRVEMQRPFAPLAIVAWVAGATVALLGSGGFIHLSGIAALDAMFVSAAVYFLMCRLVPAE